MARCKHKWKILEKINIFSGGESPCGIVYLLCCGECGKIKKVRIK